jgi:hypothetical protein
MSCLLVASLAGQQKLNLTIVEGEGAINNIRQRATREVIVQVEDENRRPVAGAVVAFTLPNQGASGSFLNGARTLTLTTDNQGRAVARFTPNRVEGKYEIRVNASHQRETAALSVSQANILGAAVATGAVSAKLLLILGLVGGAVAAGVAVAATQGNGNGNGGGGGSGGGGTRPPTTVTPGTPSVGGPQ